MKNSCLQFNVWSNKNISQSSRSFPQFASSEDIFLRLNCLVLSEDSGSGGGWELGRSQAQSTNGLTGLHEGHWPDRDVGSFLKINNWLCSKN